MLPEIRDFSSFISSEIPLPKGIRSLTIENKIPYLSKAAKVFNQKDVEKYECAIRSLKELTPSLPFKGGVRHFYISDSLEAYNVHFIEGKVQVNSIKNSKFNQYPEKIKEILIIAMERLAKELKWENTIHKIACNAIDYHFLKGSREPLGWHSDEGMIFSNCTLSIPSEYTFIILLSNPADNKHGWKGGNLLYTTARDFELGEFESEERQKIRALDKSTKGQIYNEPNSSVWEVEYAQNEGILFGNRGMNHKVTKMNPLKEFGKRLILSIFDFGEVKNELKTHANSPMLFIQ